MVIDQDAPRTLLVSRVEAAALGLARKVHLLAVPRRRMSKGTNTRLGADHWLVVPSAPIARTDTSYTPPGRPENTPRAFLVARNQVFQAPGTRVPSAVTLTIR